LGVYKFNKLFIFENKANYFDELESILDEAVGELINFIDNEAGDSLFSSLPDVEINIIGKNLNVQLTIELNISPRSNLILKEREIAEAAANVFFRKIKEGVEKRRYK
jgi:hypothetical protein